MCITVNSTIIPLNIFIIRYRRISRDGLTVNAYYFEIANIPKKRQRYNTFGRDTSQKRNVFLFLSPSSYEQRANTFQKYDKIVRFLRLYGSYKLVHNFILHIGIRLMGCTCIVSTRSANTWRFFFNLKTVI